MGLPEKKIASTGNCLYETLLHPERFAMKLNQISISVHFSTLMGQFRVGHSQLKTTQRYAHLSNETLLDAVDAASRHVQMG